MKKSELQKIIKEEISRVLNQPQKRITQDEYEELNQEFLDLRDMHKRGDLDNEDFSKYVNKLRDKGWRIRKSKINFK